MNKIQLIENNTKKILESGFIEAFIEHYVEIKNIDETENTRLMYLMCNDIEEKKVVTLNQIDKTKSIIKDIGFSTLSFAYIDNMKRNLKLEKSNSWINRFADEFKDNIIHFQSVSYLYENTYNFKDERFTDEVKVALFQEHYEHDSYLKYKPLIKDVNILLEKEDELIDDILYLIDDYQKNECWDIDILSIEHFRKYNTSIDVLFKLSELLFQLKQLSMYNEFLNYEKEEKIIKQEKKKYSEFERTLRGLNMIKDIFESQFKKASTNVFNTPILHSDGRYLNGSFNIFSNDETLSLSAFKNHYSKRYENSKRNSLFINELKELRELAQQNLDFYYSNLSENSQIFKDYHKKLPIEYIEQQAYSDEHSALVVLLNLNVSDIKFGSNLSWSKQLNYCYLTNNKDLAIICTDVVQFIDKMELVDVKEVVLNELESKECEDENISQNKIELLKTIWLPTAKLSIEEFIQCGIDKGMWNEKFDIIPQRNSMYASGKKMLAAVYVAFKNWAINGVIDYKIVGKVLCEVFNVKIKETTKEPFKSFSSTNKKVVDEIKKQFRIKI